MDWQPIETAPKDGTQVLLFWPYVTQEGLVTTGHWYRVGQGVPDYWYSPFTRLYPQDLGGDSTHAVA